MDMGSTRAICVLLGMSGDGRDPPSCFCEFNVERRGRAHDQPTVVPGAQPSADVESGERPRPRPSMSAEFMGGQTLLSMEQVWNNFFAGCEDVAAECLASGELQADALESMDPAVVLGIPARVIVRAAQRSLDPPEGSPTLGPDDWLMADGVVLSATNRPRNRVTDSFFQPVVNLKRDLRQAAP